VEHSLTSALDGGEWSASLPGLFTPRERAQMNSFPRCQLSDLKELVCVKVLCWEPNFLFTVRLVRCF